MVPTAVISDARQIRLLGINFATQDVFKVSVHTINHVKENLCFFYIKNLILSHVEVLFKTFFDN